MTFEACDDASGPVFLGAIACHAVKLPDDADMYGRHAGRTVLQFRTACDHGHWSPPVYLDPVEGIAADFSAGVARAAALVEATFRHGPVVCPGGCGRQLFGEVAMRGACFDCFPKLDEATP